MIPLSKPTIGKEELYAVERVLTSGWLTSGKEVEQFEQEFAEYVGADYAVATSSCTAALVVAIRAMKIGPDIICPSLTYAATAEAIQNAYGNPMFIDVDENGLMLDPGRGIPKVPVNIYGQEWMGVIDEYTVVDSAHRIENGMCKEKKGSFCFSFYATKNITTGEGGMLCTNDKKVADEARKIIHHGIEKNAYKREKEGWSPFGPERVGFKGNMSDILAAIGRVQLKRISEFTAKRNAIVEEYNNAFGCSHTGNYVYPLFDENRDEMMAKLKKKGIQTSISYYPLHWSLAYMRFMGSDPLQQTEYFGNNVYSIPLYPTMTDEEVDYVIRSVMTV